MAHNNGKITSPISLHGDVYPVLAIAPSGAYYDVAEACTSGKINKWSKVKPYQGHEPNYEQDGTTDPSPSGQIWGITNTQQQGSGTTYFGQFVNNTHSTEKWTYNAPVLGTHWMRLLDFNGYNQAATVFLKGGVSKTLSDKVLTSTGHPSNIINLFNNHNFMFECNASGDFTNLKVLMQNRPNLRYCVEVYQFSGLDSVAAPIAKWCSEPLSTYNGGMANVIKSFREILTSAGIPYMQLSGSGITLYCVSALQEATASGWFYGNDIVSNFNAGTAINLPDATTNFNGGSGLIFPVPVAFNFASNITALSYGCRVMGQSTPTMWTSPSQTERYTATYSTLYMKFDVAQQDLPFDICSASNTSREGIRIGAYITNPITGTLQVVNGTLCDSTWANLNVNYQTIEAGSGTETVYIRFDNILSTTNTAETASQRVRLAWTVIESPNNVIGSNGDWNDMVSNTVTLGDGTSGTNGWYTGIAQ